MTKKVIFLLGAFMLVGVAHAQAVPPAPTGVTATLNTTGQVTITWSTVTDDAGIGGYNVYRNGSFITTTAGTTVTDSPGVGSYSYTVSAYDNANITSGQSIPSGFITILPDYSTPSVPTGLTAVTATGSIALSWNAATDNIGVAGYYLYRNGAKVVTPDPISGVTYTDTGAYNGGIYKYTVSAYDAAGNISGQSNAINISLVYGVQPSAAPSSLYALPASPSEVDLHWNSPVNGIGIIGYYIFRNGAQVGIASSTMFADTGLSASTVYSYTVAAFDTAGNVSYNNTAVSATTLPPDTTPPSIPGNLSATNVMGSGVKITWSPSTDNGGISGVKGYNVFRNGTQVATVVTSTFYVDSGLATSTQYTYSVSAYDASGNISAQASFFVNTLAADPATTTSALPPSLPPPPSIGTPGTGIAGTSGTPGATPVAAGAINANLYFSLRSGDVTTLQTILIAKGYLEAQYATGFFGALTQQAVQKFQCDQNIICTGDPGTTGWGSVGPKTRMVLNAGAGSAASTGASVNTNTGASTNTSAAATLQQLLAQVQALQAKLAQMQANGQ